MEPLTVFSTAERTAHNSHKFGFTLSPTNYGFWKTMIQPLLTTNGLIGYIDGTILCPAETTTTTITSEKETSSAIVTNPSYAIWIANDAHVRMLLLSTISESSFQHVHGTTSRALWLSLEQAYAPHTSSREYTLKTQLLKLEMKGDETSSAYLNQAQGYSDALANIGEPIKEKDLVLLVPPVQAFMATTASRNTTTLPSTPTTDQLQHLQTLFSQLGLQLQQTNTPSAQAFYTNRAGNNRGRGQSNRRGKGNYNRSQGDFTNTNQNGGNRGPFSWASTQNTVYGTCNRCGIGHVPSQCPNRDPTTIRRPAPSANYADHRSQTSTSWLPDTGSSHHVTHDLQSLDRTEPYYGEDNLHVGNGFGYTHHPPHGSKYVTPPDLSAETSEGGDFMYVSQHIHK
ncbi:hypothetical protein LXL04_015391 [Taraxacum kok-saghyz]